MKTAKRSLLANVQAEKTWCGRAEEWDLRLDRLFIGLGILSGARKSDSKSCRA